jgi:hypothetical protein
LRYVRDSFAPVVQLDRTTASGAVGCAFEPRRAQKQLAPLKRHFTRVGLPKLLVQSIAHVRASKRMDYLSICQVLPS